MIKQNELSLRAPVWVRGRAVLTLPLLLLSLTLLAAGQAGDSSSAAVCAACIRSNLEYLAGPALNGRGSGTIDEYHAAQYIAAKLKAYGLAPAAENGGFIQTGSIKSRSVTTAPVLTFDAGKPVSWKHGNEFAAFQFSQPDIAAPLQKLDLSDAASLAKVSEGGSSGAAQAQARRNPARRAAGHRSLSGE